jgi:DNA-binding CsgD family transcriptional regulator/PAS domain-containing protein
MSDTQAFLECIEAVYDAGTDVERWPHALAALSDLINGQMGTLAYFTPREILVEILTDPAWAGRMTDYIEHNLWYQRRHLAPLNRAVPSEQLASPAEVKRTALYADMLREADLLHMCGIMFLNKGPYFGNVAVLRSERLGPFEPGEVELMDAVAPHLSRAMRVSHLLHEASLYATDLEAAADHLPFGLVLIDRLGRIIYANAMAGEMLAAGSLRTGLDGRILASSGKGGDAIQALLKGVSVRREAAGTRLRGRDGSDLKIIGAPLPRRRQDFACTARTAAAVLFLFDETREEPPPVALIAQIYRLTSAEARLVQALLAGDSLNEYAGRAGLSRNTVKTQLGALFGKTETRRQSELIRQLSRLAAAFSSDRYNKAFLPR